jgi:uncharacterized protein (TIGR02646 family)
MDCTYDEMRRSPAVLEAVEDSLLAEQGWICAYTGQRIGIAQTDPSGGVRRVVDMHIEHLVPQKHCDYGRDADYDNLVACWPKPNCGFEPAYGARRKGDWPSPQEQALFVSPLQSDCSHRFVFNRRGEISPAVAQDAAAAETITRLGLADETLKALRREAVYGALNPRSRPISLSVARKLSKEIERDFIALDAGQNVKLKMFCFVIKQVLEREIKKLEGIVAGSRRNSKS